MVLVRERSNDGDDFREIGIVKSYNQMNTQTTSSMGGDVHQRLISNPTGRWDMLACVGAIAAAILLRFIVISVKRTQSTFWGSAEASGCQADDF
jgi:hypothetical protein